MSPERKQSEIEKGMGLWGEKVLSQVKEVSMDMSYNYKSLVNKLCPNASVTVDRFHVTKMIHEELNQARINQKKVAESLNVKEKVKLFSSLKGSKDILLKAEQNLSQNKKQNKIIRGKNSFTAS